MKTVDLLNYVNSHEKGINMQLDNRGEDMPLGIRKRVGHARSLINDAKLILFDEPTEGLDKLGKDAMYDLLKYFKSKNKTIFVASNDQSIIDISDKCLDLNEGLVNTAIKKIVNKSNKVENLNYKYKRTTNLLFYSFSIFTVLIIIWSFIFEVDIVSNADGQVIPVGEVKTIQHLEGV